MDDPEFSINKALASLKAQGIEVSNAGITPNGGMVRAVMGFMLTNKQILELYAADKLDKAGISDFARRYEEEHKKGNPGRES